MTSWRTALGVYRSRRMLAILCMGFSSGLPILLVFSTLSYWLREAGVSRTEIGLFVLVGISYSFKFVWSPIIDRLPLPLLTRRLGRRRSWALAIQLPLMAAIFALGSTDPKANLAATALFAVIVAFLSASQDIVIDAYRIELLQPDEQGAGAAATQWGYRIGTLAGSTGVFDAAQFGGWHFAYTIMAALMLVGIVTVLMTREPEVPAAALPRAPHGTRRQRIARWASTAIVDPFRDFMGRRAWVAILVLIVLYKLGEALAGTMSNTLYQELAFAKDEVGNIGKIVGLVATLSGVAVGGALVARQGLFRALLYAGVLQMFGNLLYVALLLAGHNNVMLALSIFGENFTGGMASAAFVAYLSSLCNIAFTATQYALFSSLAAVPARFLAAPSGWLVDQFNWIPFFLLATLACLPSLFLLVWLRRRAGIDAPPASSAMPAE
ncbi:MAG TPA: MFS transporter [Stellaceae bacterium]|nr:MFS transporter [Stellaceae bacterium]